MPDPTAGQRVAAVRRFNRFYTRQIGVLHEGLLHSPFSLTEGRVLYELAHRERPTATALRGALGLDSGYLSRILQRFARRGLVARAPSRDDRREMLLQLTKQGRRAFAPLETRANDEVRAMLRRLHAPAERRLVGAMRDIERLLGTPSADPGHDAPPYRLRRHRPGDMGWVVHRHGALYAEEYRWDERFEALVAHIVAEFIDTFDPRRERCWIAEHHGEIVGSVFLVQKSKTVAKLRLLLVEPSARGLGIGRRLVDECARFARRVGYRKITLWTQKNLTAARHIYQTAGYRLVGEEPHHSFGHDLVAETWELAL